MARPDDYDLLALPQSTLHLPALTWSTTLAPGRLIWRHWHYIIGLADTTESEAYLTNAAERIPLSQVNLHNPIANTAKWTLESTKPVKVIVATIEATMERLIDTILMCGGKIVLVPVPYVPVVTPVTPATEPPDIAYSDLGNNGGINDQNRQLVCY